MTLTISMRLPTPNVHGSTRERIGRGKRQRETVGWHLVNLPKPLVPCRVKLVRLGPRAIGSDGAIASLKHVRDSVAMWLLGGKPGELDDDPRIEWCYPAAERATLVGVRLEFEELAP